MAIGAPGNYYNADSYSGRVRVYEWNADTIPPSWQQKGEDIDGEAAGDSSGGSVSLSSDGNVVAIGAEGNGSYSGHVRVYKWKVDSSPPSWEKMGQDIDGEAASDFSGSSVSLSGNGTVLAIGAPYNAGNGTSSGHVRVYEWNATSPPSWDQMGEDIDGEAACDYSGRSVSLSSDGTVLAIGAVDNDGGNDFYNSGHVRVYKWNGSWDQMGLDIDGEAAVDSSGYSVSLSGDGAVLAIGAPGNDDNGTSSGHVRVYEWNGSWDQMGLDIDGEADGDRSGGSVSLSNDGTVLAIGAPGNYQSDASYSGRVRVYEWNFVTSSWQQMLDDIDGEAAGDRSGVSVSLSGDGTVLAIGAPGNIGEIGTGSNTGHVRVYKY